MTMLDWFNRMKSAVDGKDGAGASGGGGRRGPGAPSLAEKLQLNRITDEALGAELERRRRLRGRPAHRRPCADDELDAVAQARRARLRELPLSKAYANLSVSQTAPRAEVERAFRVQLREFHPDRRLGDPQDHATAIAIVSSLADAYLAVLRTMDPRR